MEQVADAEMDLVAVHDEEDNIIDDSKKVKDKEKCNREDQKESKQPMKLVQ